MNHTHSHKRKRSNDSISDFRKDNKRFRIDEIIDTDHENGKKEIIDNLKQKSPSRQVNYSNNNVIHFDEIKSEYFLSRQKTNFMHALWKLEIPFPQINKNFRKTEVIEIHNNIPCATLLDFNFCRKEFSFVIKLGEGDDIKSYLEIKRIKEKFQFEELNKVKNQNKNENVEEIKIQDFLSEKIESKYVDSSISASPSSITINSVSPRNSRYGSRDENKKRYANKGYRTKEQEEEKLKLDLEQKHTNSPESSIGQDKVCYLKLRAQINEDSERSFAEIGPDRQKNLINGIGNSMPTKEYLENTANSLNVESFNISINFFLVNNESINFSFYNVLPGDVKIQTLKISDDKYAELIYSNMNRIYSIVIQINIDKKLPSITKYVGIINEGTTCYMNSMLQSLNFLGYFKNSVFQIPVSFKEDLSQSVTYSLQKIFFDMMTESKAISVLRLIKSFGWSREEMLIQHDVQEFNLNLSELMENKMKGTKVEGTFKYLFEGKIMNYIQCLNVDYKSIKEENFLDLQLTVKECKNIYESFDKYTEEEILDKENKYDAEEYGKQVAKKGVKFLELPNVLILQLKRFEYNFQKDMMEKVNDYFEFYNAIDLSKYVTNREGDSTGLYTYSLHSVLVHAGFPNTGHYYAYIKPEVNSRWVKFNDENVQYADDYEVFENNFGGDLNMYKNLSTGEIIKQEFISDSNAYILIYIKNSMKETILREVSDQDIPVELKNLFQKDKLEEKKQILKDIRNRFNMTVNLFSREILTKHSSLGLTPTLCSVDEDLFYKSVKNSITISVPRDMKIIDFIQYLSSRTNIPSFKIQLFKYVLLYNTVLLKRFYYSANYIDKTYYNNSIEELTKIIPPKKYPFLIYVHIDECEDSNFSFLEEGHQLDDSISNYKENQNFENSEEIIAQIDNLLMDNTNSYTIDTPEEEYVSMMIENQNNPNFKNNQILYFSKRENFWGFKKNLYNKSSLPFNGSNLISIPSVCNEIEMVREDGNVLCVIKYLKIKLIDDNIYETKLQVGDIITLKSFQSLSHLNNKINFKERYKNYLDENLLRAINRYDESQINFMMEFCSYNDILANIKFNSVFVCRDSASLDRLNNSVISVIININWKEKINFFNREINSLQDLIQESCNNHLKTVSIQFHYLADRKKDIIRNYNHGERMKLRLDMSDSELRELIYNDFNSDLRGKNLVKEMFSLQNPFDKSSNLEYHVFNIHSELLSIHEFLTKSPSDIIELNPLVEKERENIQFYREYPVIKYIHRKADDFSIIFAINFLPPPHYDQTKHYYVVDFHIFDIDNNMSSRLTVCLPRNVCKFSEILEFLNKQNIISKLYKNFNDTQVSSKILTYEENVQKNELDSLDDKFISSKEDKLSLDNFLFILQHPETMIAYDIIGNKEENLREYELKSNNIAYRLQPYPHYEIPLISPSNKLFYSVVDSEYSPIYFPLVIFLDKNTTKVITMKNLIIEKLKKIECVRKAYEEDLNSKNCLTRVKFFTSILQNFIPRPLTFLNNEKDENMLNELFEKGPPNFLVKLPSKGINILFLKQG